MRQKNTPEYNREYYFQNTKIKRDKLKISRIELSIEERRKRLNNKANEYNKRIRFLVLQHYSTLIPFCNCCGEKELKFLSIDHINGGGNQHRKKLGYKDGKGGNIYHWLNRNNFPEGFQVLCHNCNMAKGFYGMCPHRVDK